MANIYNTINITIILARFDWRELDLPDLIQRNRDL